MKRELKKDNLLLRTIDMRSDDANYIYQWLNDDRILKYFGGRDKKRSRADIHHEFAKKEWGTPVMIVYDYTRIGFIDIVKFDALQKRRHGLQENEDNIFAIDIVIGNPAYQNKGVGSKALSIILDFLFNTLHASKVVLDT